MCSRWPGRSAGVTGSSDDIGAGLHPSLLAEGGQGVCVCVCVRARVGVYMCGIAFELTHTHAHPERDNRHLFVAEC